MPGFKRTRVNHFHANYVIFIRPVKQNFERKIAIILLSTSLNMCFGRSKEPSYRDGSFE